MWFRKSLHRHGGEQCWMGKTSALFELPLCTSRSITAQIDSLFMLMAAGCVQSSGVCSRQTAAPTWVRVGPAAYETLSYRWRGVWETLPRRVPANKEWWPHEYLLANLLNASMQFIFRSPLCVVSLSRGVMWYSFLPSASPLRSPIDPSRRWTVPEKASVNAGGALSEKIHRIQRGKQLFFLKCFHEVSAANVRRAASRRHSTSSNAQSVGANRSAHLSKCSGI